MSRNVPVDIAFSEYFLTRRQVHRVGAILDNYDEVNAAYLFGPRARKKDVSDRYYSIGVLFDGYFKTESARHWESCQIMDHFYRVFGYKNVQVLAVNDLKREFQKEIVKLGVVLYSRHDENRLQWEHSLKRKAPTNGRFHPGSEF